MIVWLSTTAINASWNKNCKIIVLLIRNKSVKIDLRENQILDDTHLFFNMKLFKLSRHAPKICQSSTEAIICIFQCKV